MYQHHRGRVREAHQLPQDKLDRRPALDARVNALPDVCRAAHVGGRLMVDAENEAGMAGHPEQVLSIWPRRAELEGELAEASTLRSLLAAGYFPQR